MTDTVQSVEPIVIERVIAASAEQIYPYLVEADKLAEWLAIEAETDPRPGGINHQTHSGPPGDTDGPYYMRGEFTELRPNQYVAFTWGWEGSEMGNPPGSSNVEVELLPHDDGTLLRLTHSNLRVEGGHRDGWRTLVEKLAELFDQD